MLTKSDRSFKLRQTRQIVVFAYSEREPFGPTYGSQEQGEEGGKGVK